MLDTSKDEKSIDITLFLEVVFADEDFPPSADVPSVVVATASPEEVVSLPSCIIDMVEVVDEGPEVLVPQPTKAPKQNTNKNKKQRILFITYMLAPLITWQYLKQRCTLRFNGVFTGSKIHRHGNTVGKPCTLLCITAIQKFMRYHFTVHDFFL